MKKKISIMLIIIWCAVIATFMIGCPSNIQPGNYRLYTVNGIVTKADGETGIENILIEVRNQKVAEKDANVVMKFSSGDENFVAASTAYARGSNNDSSSSSGDGNSQDSSDSSTIEDSSSSSSSSSGEKTRDATDDQKSSSDENPILNSCRTGADGKFTLTFKSYDSDTNLTFLIYATDDDGNENGGTFKTDPMPITFGEIQDDEPANPYGTYKKSSKEYETEIKIKMN